MKRFIYQTLIFSFFVLLTFWWLLFKADGHNDPYYVKFSTPKQNSLILGTSRALQGIQPEVLLKELNEKIFNYAFTLRHSPYGPAYLRSVKKKLNPAADTGIYILAVDPWSISSRLKNLNDTTYFREVGACVDKTEKVDVNPNYSYLIHNLKGRYYQLLFGDKHTYTHPDGWLEVTVNMDHREVERRTKGKLQDYRDKLSRYGFSDTRYDYLKKIILFLKGHGKVYLVRLPVDPGMMKIEDEFMPRFNDKMKALLPLADGYFDMTPFNGDYQYVDGNHLYKNSGKDVSLKIGKWIKEKQLTNK